MQNNRRTFIKQVAALSVGAGMAPDYLGVFPVIAANEGKGYTLLFQGDSITDGNRSRKAGAGY